MEKSDNIGNPDMIDGTTKKENEVENVKNDSPSDESVDSKTDSSVTQEEVRPFDYFIKWDHKPNEIISRTNDIIKYM